jgi:pimeloyl-ACP methyl ester carboxylesterase
LTSQLPIVCIPGTLCDARVFAPVLELMQWREVVHAPRLDAGDVGVAAVALLAAAPPRFVVMAFSLGGFVAIEAMRRAPQRVAGAVMISTNAHPDPPANAVARRAQVTMARDEGMDALVDVLWPGYVSPASIARSDLKSTVLAMARSVGPAALAQQAEIAIGRPDCREWAAGQTTPMLVVCGDRDTLCSMERYQALASSPAATLTVIPGAGHFAPLEAARESAAAIDPWLARIDKTSARHEVTPLCS